MAVSVRSLLLSKSLLLLLTHFVAASQLLSVQGPNLIFDTNDGTTVVYSALTGEQIPQGPASDGSGSGFSLSAVLWIVFSFVLGAPLLSLGFRGHRWTLGAAVGIAAVLAFWAVIVNTLDDVGVSDVLLTLFVFIIFVLGFALGFLEMTRVLAILGLGTLGGLAIGIRIILFRRGLLIPGSDTFFVNWLLIGMCGVAGSILVICRQTYGILNGCASTGSFLCALAFDLVINQQSGMSRGLRFLFDRNRFHALDTATNSYSPPMTTIIILAVSLAVTPAFAFAQWKVFKHPFSGTKHDTFIESIWDEESIQVPQTAEKPSKEGPSN